MTFVYFMHGWGYDASFWAPLCACLPNIQPLYADAGYFGAPAQPPLPQAPFWAVGHSAGVSSLLPHALTSSHCLGLVSINGFARFSQTEDFPQGVPGRILSRMSKQLTRNPQNVLTSFYQMCGDTTPNLSSKLHIEQLQNGLKALQDNDMRALLPQWQGRLYEIISPDDPLSPARTGLQYATQSLSLSGGHLLPRTHPHACAQYLQSLMTAS